MERYSLVIKTDTVDRSMVEALVERWITTRFTPDLQYRIHAITTAEVTVIIWHDSDWHASKKLNEWFLEDMDNPVGSEFPVGSLLWWRPMTPGEVLS